METFRKPTPSHSSGGKVGSLVCKSIQERELEKNRETKEKKEEDKGNYDNEME